jgi:hypothetical protein
VDGGLVDGIEIRWWYVGMYKTKKTKMDQPNRISKMKTKRTRNNSHRDIEKVGQCRESIPFLSPSYVLLKRLSVIKHHHVVKTLKPHTS